MKMNRYPETMPTNEDAEYLVWIKIGYYSYYRIAYFETLPNGEHQWYDYSSENESMLIIFDDVVGWTELSETPQFGE